MAQTAYKWGRGVILTTYDSWDDPPSTCDPRGMACRRRWRHNRCLRRRTPLTTGGDDVFFWKCMDVPTIGVEHPQNGWCFNNGKPYFLMDDLGYHNFWKHPYGNVFPFYKKKMLDEKLAKFWGTKGCRKPVPMLECWTRRVRQEQVDASFASQHLGGKDGPKMNLPNTSNPFWFVPEIWSHGETMSLYESALAVKARLVGFPSCERVNWWMVSARCKVSHGDAVERSLCHVRWPSRWVSDDFAVGEAVR